MISLRNKLILMLTNFKILIVQELCAYGNVTNRGKTVIVTIVYEVNHKPCLTL